ncbi:MAG: hypothetical protein LQ346_005790 [Caloplaca aetnensis]|nr:MAG: hypothetical protein LQ346_005790 [Caloplaca aetnensis]
MLVLTLLRPLTWLMIVPNLIDPNLASLKSLDWPSIRIFERPTLCHTSLSRTQCQVSWLTVVTVATLNTVRFASSRLASIATTQLRGNSHGTASASVKSEERGRVDKARNKYRLQASNRADALRDGSVRNIRSLNGQELSALRTMFMDDAIPSIGNTLHLFNSEIDSLRKAIDRGAQHPMNEDCEDPLVARLAALQEDLQEWEAEWDLVTQRAA